MGFMKRLGFTLVELLVVIAILSLLLAVTSTALHSAREKAKATTCQAHLRQLGMGLLIYAQDNDRFPLAMLPSGEGTIGSLSYDMRAIWWFQSIGLDPRESDMARGLLQCPSKQLDGPGSLNYNILWSNYGVNWSVCASRKFVLPLKYQSTLSTSISPTQIKHPDRLFLVGDSGYTVVGWHHVVTPETPFVNTTNPLATSYIPGLSINKDRKLNGIQQSDATLGRHANRTVNVSFVDGHAEMMHADELLVTETEDGHYDNRSPLWLPK